MRSPLNSSTNSRPVLVDLAIASPLVRVIISVICHLYLTSVPPVRRAASIVAVHLKEEPVAALGLVDPILQQDCAGEIAMRSAQRVVPPHPLGDHAAVAPQPRQHLAHGRVRRSAVANPVQATDLAD